MSSFIAKIKDGDLFLGAVGLDINIEEFKLKENETGIKFSDKIYYFILDNKQNVLLHSQFAQTTETKFIAEIEYPDNGESEEAFNF